MSDYLILSRDIPVAKWENNQLTVLNEQLLPLYLKRVKNADMWLATRAIDSHRANSRLLKKALRLTERDDVSTVLHVNGATITDNYWIKPIDSALTYAQIKFDNDYFSRLALKGNYDSFNRAANSKHSKTPELTNIRSDLPTFRNASKPSRYAMNLLTKSTRQWQRLREWDRKPSPARLPFPRTITSSSRHLPRRVSQAAVKSKI